MYEAAESILSWLNSAILSHHLTLPGSLTSQRPCPTGVKVHRAWLRIKGVNLSVSNHRLTAGGHPIKPESGWRIREASSEFFYSAPAGVRCWIYTQQAGHIPDDPEFVFGGALCPMLE